MTVQPLITIMIPVYNIEPYIEKCLQSVCNQTYENLQIIIVDDCSTDGSLQICELYAEKHRNIQVVHNQTNQGLSASRNIAMTYATGDFYLFIDGDDWIEEDLCEKAVELLREDGRADTVHWGYQSVLEDGTVLSQSNPILYPQKYIEQPQIFDEFIGTLVVSLNDLYNWFTSKQSYYDAIHSKKQMGTVWRYLLSSEIIRKNNLQFNLHAGRGEDIVFVISYLQNCKRILNYTGLAYGYLQRSNSLSRDDISLYKKIELMEAMEETTQYAPEAKKEELRDKWRGQRILVVMNTARKMVKVRGFWQGYIEYSKVAKHPISRDAYDKVKLDNMPFKYKAAIGFIKYKCYFLFYSCIYLMKIMHIDMAPMD